MVRPIPDRWLQYKACGNIIEGTRIICFKVPLKTSVQTKSVDSKNVWDIKELLKKIPKLGAVIDLTNTARYYNPKKFEAASIYHKKILMPGRIIPPENKVREFMNTLDEFFENDKERLVGVHCTHGLNRTGYMVCRYLRDRLKMPAKDAIRRFEIARGYQIERDNYIADLLGKSPLPPDLGPDTKVKPMTEERLKKCKFNQETNDEDIEGRFKNEHPFDCKTSLKGDWKWQRKVRERSSSEKSDRSYDFKYDY